MRLFRVKTIPNPVACIGEYCRNASISKSELLAQKGLIVMFPNFDFDIFFKIIRFKMTLITNTGELKSLESKNNLLTHEMKDLIERLTSGTKITFENIKVITPDSQVRLLAALNIVVK